MELLNTSCLPHTCLQKAMSPSGDCKHGSASCAYHTCLQINLAVRLAHVYTIPALESVPVEDHMKGTPGSGDTRCMGNRYAYLQEGCVFPYARIIDGFHYLGLPRIHHSVMPQRRMHGECSPPCAAYMSKVVSHILVLCIYSEVALSEIHAWPALHLHAAPHNQASCP